MYKGRDRKIADPRDEVEDAEALKGRLRQLGNYLRNQIRIFRQKYAEEDIAFEAVDRGSKMINKCEEKMGNYVSIKTYYH